MRRALIAIAAALLLACGSTPRNTAMPNPTPSGRDDRTTGGAAGPPTFHGTISKLDPATRRRMLGSSWHRGCPVLRRDLRLLRVDRWGFDGEVHHGSVIVRKHWARPILGVFRTLFSVKFRFRDIELADEFDGDDHKLMRADITSAFNCRFAEGRPGVWSEHAYGRAIDINPVENPYVAGATVLPPAGDRYLDRTKRRPGMIHDRGAVVRAFAAIGWEWGGHFRSLKDYMHFSATGR